MRGSVVLGELVVHRPHLGVSLGSGLVALLLAAALWWIVGHAVTLAHEGGHALIALLVGKVDNLQVSRDRTGVTYYSSGWLGRILVGLAGYLAPSAFGLAAVALIVVGQVTAVIWLSLLFLALALLVAGSWFTRLVIVAIGATLVLVLRARSADLSLWTTCIWAWLLLIGGAVGAVNHFGSGSDHFALRERTFIPVWIWSVLFAGFAFVALVYAFAWFTGLGTPPLVAPGG